MIICYIDEIEVRHPNKCRCGFCRREKSIYNYMKRKVGWLKDNYRSGRLE